MLVLGQILFYQVFSEGGGSLLKYAQWYQVHVSRGHCEAQTCVHQVIFCKWGVGVKAVNIGLFLDPGVNPTHHIYVVPLQRSTLAVHHIRLPHVRSSSFFSEGGCRC